MVTGLGGIFIKADDPKFLARWYEDNLGIGFRHSLHFSFKWREQENPAEISHTILSFFSNDTTSFYPSAREIMLNFRVSDLDGMRIRLRKKGVNVIDKIESYAYGRFGWVMDPEGNKIELWEAKDDGFEERNYPMDLKNITAPGGVFMKSVSPEKQMQWYSHNLGLDFTNATHSFSWKDFSDESIGGQTLVSFLPQSTVYLNPSPKDFMINFRVRNLDEIIGEVKRSGEIVSDRIEEFEHGRFGWIMDPEKNKIELWEPYDLNL
jgi:predicted enzyme related to lactoylglutathione lyase